MNIRCLTMGIGALVALLLPAAAMAQSAPPIGLWATADGSEQLYVGNDGQCMLSVGGTPSSAGACSWDATYSGGILTVMSTMTYQPAPVYFNITYIDQGTISVEGDVMTRRQ